MININLSDNAIKIFETLYSFQDESIDQTFHRVAKEFATSPEQEERAYQLLAENIWRPNTPVFLNVGTKHKIYSACFVSGLEDSMDSIYDVANVSRKIFQYGSGVGIPIGNLREKNAYIYEGETEIPPEGKSSGSITFMKLFDAVGETTKSGGRVRRAAILCSMPVWHPDIMDFIGCKEVEGRLANMNISVSITDKFMQALSDKTPFKLVSPYQGNEAGEIDPQEVWDSIATMAHRTADPGVIFIDTVNKYNPLIKKHLIETSNPCIVGNALVITDKGNIPIKDVTINDKVLSYNDNTKETEWDDVIFSGRTRNDSDVIKIELDDGSFLELTPDHKVYTENRGYVKASQLTDSDILFFIE